MLLLLESSLQYRWFSLYCHGWQVTPSFWCELLRLIDNFMTEIMRRLWQRDLQSNFFEATLYSMECRQIPFISCKFDLYINHNFICIQSPLRIPNWLILLHFTYIKWSIAMWYFDNQDNNIMWTMPRFWFHQHEHSKKNSLTSVQSASWWIHAIE